MADDPGNVRCRDHWRRPRWQYGCDFARKAGRRVVVLEREKFPRFHIGESLLPASMRTFTRLGVQEKLRANFMEKFGGEMSSSCSIEGVRFYFKDGYGPKPIARIR